jgi:23S rRNA (adenine2030-N6)-methyltransferase
MVIVNPPFTLRDELTTILPALQHVLAQERGAASGTRWLAAERSPGAD